MFRLTDQVGGGKSYAHRFIQRQSRVVLAPGFIASTIPGSLYSVLLLMLAKLGRLALHNHLFETFAANQTAATARQLLKKIGVDRNQLDPAVRGDDQFAEHAERRTRRLRHLAAKGDQRARGILQNRKICDAKSRWIGDIDEATSILTGNSAPNLPGIRKNVRILRKMKLLFNVTQRGAQQVCYLYPQKYHHLFVRARKLAGE